jgi:hypothetical protein
MRQAGGVDFYPAESLHHGEKLKRRLILVREIVFGKVDTAYERQNVRAAHFIYSLLFTLFFI